MEKENPNLTKAQEYALEVLDLVQNGTQEMTLADALGEYHENDIALAILIMDEGERHVLYDALCDDMLALVMEYVELPTPYLDELEFDRRAKILEKMEPSLAVDYLKELERHERHRHLRLFSKEARENIFLLASFDEDEIGSRMSDNFIAVTEADGVRGAMSKLVREAAEHDNVSTLFVVDEEGKFVGAIDLKDLIVARSDTPLSDIIRTNFPTVETEELVDECIIRLLSYSEDSIPVLDHEGVLVGVLTDDILADLTREDFEEDYARLAGLTSEEHIEEGLSASVKARLPWLAVLFFLGFLVSGVVGFFEGVVSELTLLVSFQSLILGMAGNVGTQSLAVTIRMLADDRAGKGAKLRQVLKEMGVGLFNGSIMALGSFVLVLGYLTLLRGEPFSSSLLVAFSIAIALVLSMLLSGLFGSVIPMLFQKIGIDPAVASGPFITTVSDLVAVITYYGLAGVLLKFFL